jgi:SAM-dependent methyltransferase
MDNKLIDIGLGILQSPTKGRYKTMQINGKKHYRFLNNLYLPCKTDLLSKEQVIITNRFREKNFKIDSQFEYNVKIKEIFKFILSKFNNPSVLEIGAGRFPLINKKDDYTIVDIDKEIKTYLLENNQHCILEEELNTLKSKHYDICIACFVCHFCISPKAIESYKNILKDDGIIIFNVITHDSNIKTNILSEFTSKYGFVGKSLNMDKFYKKSDTIFFLTKDKQNPNFTHLVSETNKFIEKSL